MERSKRGCPWRNKIGWGWRSVFVRVSTQISSRCGLTKFKVFIYFVEGTVVSKQVKQQLRTKGEREEGNEREWRNNKRRKGTQRLQKGSFERTVLTSYLGNSNIGLQKRSIVYIKTYKQTK